MGSSLWEFNVESIGRDIKVPAARGWSYLRRATNQSLQSFWDPTNRNLQTQKHSIRYFLDCWRWISFENLCPARGAVPSDLTLELSWTSLARLLGDLGSKMASRWRRNWFTFEWFVDLFLRILNAHQGDWTRRSQDTNSDQAFEPSRNRLYIQLKMVKPFSKSKHAINQI